MYRVATWLSLGIDIFVRGPINQRVEHSFGAAQSEALDFFPEGCHLVRRQILLTGTFSLCQTLEDSECLVLHIVGTEHINQAQ